MEAKIARFVQLAMMGSAGRTEEQDDELHALYDEVFCTTPHKPEIAAELKLAISAYAMEYPKHRKLTAEEIFTMLGAKKCE
jgi:hypothetical protein